ncbi:MAG TPA: DinB family protein [Ktedonobacterales bacterium]|nr:DinB family protein [Ktedonobacterales bacterium]
MSETIPETIEKDELVRRIQAGYDKFEAILAPLSAAQMTTPNVNGPWSVKDNLAHLTIWQEYLRSHLEGILTNHEPPEFMPGLSSEDEENERIYQENKDRPLAEVQSAFRASYQHVLAAVQAVSEEALNAPLPWRPSNGPVWPFIVGNTFGHYEEHGAIIQRWLAGAQ